MYIILVQQDDKSTQLVCSRLRNARSIEPSRNVHLYAYDVLRTRHQLRRKMLENCVLFTFSTILLLRTQQPNLHTDTYTGSTTHSVEDSRPIPANLAHIPQPNPRPILLRSCSKQFQTHPLQRPCCTSAVRAAQFRVHGRAASSFHTTHAAARRAIAGSTRRVVRRTGPRRTPHRRRRLRDLTVLCSVAKGKAYTENTLMLCVPRVLSRCLCTYWKPFENVFFFWFFLFFGGGAMGIGQCMESIVWGFRQQVFVLFFFGCCCSCVLCAVFCVRVSYHEDLHTNNQYGSTQQYCGAYE